MKKAYTLRLLAGLTACLCLAAVPGCGQPQSSSAGLLDPKNPTTIQVWTYYNGPQKLAFDALVLEFNDTVGKEQGIAVDTVSYGNVGELTQSVLDAAAKKVGASEIPQVFAAYADTAYEVDQMGLVASLDAYFTAEELAEFVPSYMEEGRFDSEGSLKIFPIAKSTEIMMLNETAWNSFSESTGAQLSALSTMEGLAETAALYYEWTDSVTPEPGDGNAFFGRDAMANYFIVGAKQLGIEIFSAKNGVISLNCDKAVLHRLWDNFYIPFLKGHYAAHGKFRSDDLKTGKIISFVCSTSGAAFFPSEVSLSDTESYPIEAIVLPAPIFEGGKAVAVQQGAGMVVAKSTPAKEHAAVVFLKWFTQPERNVHFSTESSYLPVKTAANDAQLLLDALAQLEPTHLNENLALALPVAVQTVKDSELYTNKAFYGGTQARAVLEHSMMDLLEADLAAVAEMVAGGTPREEAVATFTTEEHFESWYAALVQALEATTAPQ